MSVQNARQGRAFSCGSLTFAMFTYLGGGTRFPWWDENDSNPAIVENLESSLGLGNGERAEAAVGLP